MKGYFLLFLVLLLSFLLQTTLIPLITFLGVSINLPLVLLINLSLLLGPKKGISLGIFLGLLKDLYGSGFFGIHLFIQMLLSYLAGSLSQKIYPYHYLIPFLTVLGATISHQLLSIILSEALIFTMSWEWFIKRVFFQSLLNGLLTLFIFPLCQWGLNYLTIRRLI